MTLVIEHGGSLQRVFGAETSGSVAVYDAAGGLPFNGGITAARGHSGINAGQVSLIAFLDTGARDDEPADASTPVFGCPLRTPSTTDDDRQDRR